MSLISTTNKLYLTDPVVKAMLESVQIEINDVLSSAAALERQYWIDTADTSIRDWEQHFGVKIVSSVLEDRRGMRLLPKCALLETWTLNSLSAWPTHGKTARSM